MRNQPFARAKALFAAVTAAMALSPLEQMLALQALPRYQSRGKGRRARRLCRTNFSYRGGYRSKRGEQEAIRREIGGWAKYPMTKAEYLGGL